jgi:alcohol dehydrogenase, propanol-preferring
MKAWIFSGAGKPLELKDVPEPTAKPGEIVIDVKATGLCHSDVSALDDPNWAVNFQDEPVVLGHEIAGVVSEVGEGVTNLKVGDRVGVPSGPPNVNGYFRDGGYAEKTTAIAEEVVKIPDSLDFIRAASGTDAGNVAHHAVVTRGGAADGMKVGIIGLGGLGQIGARIAVVRGCEVYVAEVKEGVWPLAQEIGARDVAKDITAFRDKDLDLIVDFAGFGTTTTGAIETVREYGRVVQVGMGRIVFEFNSNPLIIRQVELVGSMGGGIEDLSGVYDLMESGQLDPTITTMSFHEIDEGLDRLRQGTVTGRIVIDMQNGI